MNNVVLVVAAHADDEALGCGGTIAKHASNGDSVHLVLMADGVNSRRGIDNLGIKARTKAANEAAALLGISSVHFLGLPDNAMDKLSLLEVIQPLEKLVVELRPQVVYTHHHGDLNIDHRLTQQAVMTACRPQPGCTVREIFGFEVLSSTEWNQPQFHPFAPSMFVDISLQMASKLEALRAYHIEMRDSPHSRSVEHAEVLARHRGLSVGTEFAEAFLVYRLIR